MSAADDRTVQVKRHGGRWGAIPEWLLDSGVGSHAVHLFALMDTKWADRDTAELWPSRKTMAAAMGFSTSTVDRAMQELISVGAVKVTRRRDAKNEWTSSLIELFHVPHLTRGATHTSPVVLPSITGDEQTSIIEPESGTTSRRTPSASDLELLRQFATMVGGNLEDLVIAAAEGDRLAEEKLDLLHQLAAKARNPDDDARMIDRPVEERFEDTEATRLAIKLSEMYLAAMPPGTKALTVTRAWVQEADRMLRLDGRTRGEIREVLDWVFVDPTGAWWITNIKSMKKFRAQFDTLRAKMLEAKRAPAPGQRRSTLTPPITDGDVPRFLADGSENPAYAAAMAAFEANMADDLTEGERAFFQTTNQGGPA